MNPRPTALLPIATRLLPISYPSKRAANSVTTMRMTSRCESATHCYPSTANLRARDHAQARIRVRACRKCLHLMGSNGYHGQVATDLVVLSLFMTHATRPVMGSLTGSVMGSNGYQPARSRSLPSRLIPCRLIFCQRLVEPTRPPDRYLVATSVPKARGNGHVVGHSFFRRAGFSEAPGVCLAEGQTRRAAITHSVPKHTPGHPHGR